MNLRSLINIISSPLRAKPSFLIIGAQKAGTMAAVKNLNKHPEIFCLKEPHYFVDHDVFGVLRECLKTKSHIKFLYVSNIITILLS